MKTMIEIHILQNFAPSNLNRDDTGAPKDAFFGGTRRARISSQCIKRAIRQYFNQMKDLKVFLPEELADRTKRLFGELKRILSDRGRQATEIDLKIEMALNSMGFKLKGEKSEYLLFLGKSEISRLADLIDKKWNEIGDPIARVSAIKLNIKEGLPTGNGSDEKLKAIFYFLKILDDKPIKEDELVAIENNIDEILEILVSHFEIIELLNDEMLLGKGKKRKKSEMAEWEKMIQEILKEGKKGVSPLGKAFLGVLDGGKAVDVALFGRMLADMPEKNQYAACQVAHAISTHAVEREFDFYTAVDDLKPEDTAGADMMGTVEFNSACFYRYAVVDWEKLVINLQNDKELAVKGLKAFLQGFVVAEPTGMQNTFAAHNPPEFVVVSVRSNTAPRSLANAFETAVRVKKDESLTKESAGRLSSKAVALDKLYGTSPNIRYALTEDVFGKNYEDKGLGQKLDDVPALIEWAVKKALEKEE
jgi:CRISPR system Cascade subunit CasC